MIIINNFKHKTIIEKEKRHGMIITSLFNVYPTKYEGYYIRHDNSDIFSFKNGKIKKLKQFLRGGSRGNVYKSVRINKKNVYVQRIHAETFCYNDDKLNKTEVDHINGRHTENTDGNLRWISRKGNVQARYDLKKYGNIEPLPLKFNKVSDLYMLDNLIIEFTKHNEDFKVIESKDNYSYEIHSIKKVDLLEFANPKELDLVHDERLNTINFAVIRVQENNLGNKYKFLGIYPTIYQANDRVKANERELLAV